MLETLTCQFDGHSWERERKRGRKPPFCPVHPKGFRHPHAEPITPAELPSSKASDAALEILTADHWLDREFRLKLDYVVTQLDDPINLMRRDHRDIALLVKRQQELVREYHRRWGNRAVSTKVDELSNV